MCCNVIIYIDATRKYRPYSISVADRLDSIAQQQEVWCQLLYRAVEKFIRHCEHETLKRRIRYYLRVLNVLKYASHREGL